MNLRKVFFESHSLLYHCKGGKEARTTIQGESEAVEVLGDGVTAITVALCILRKYHFHEDATWCYCSLGYLPLIQFFVVKVADLNMLT